ncbi:MAG: hypothetical protein MCM46_09555 [Candidatus Manganitrophus sp. SB1]|nr:hypothetical protein [Candidatus Manganitrophus morganii]
MSQPRNILPDSYKQPAPTVSEKDFWVDPDPKSTGLLLSDRIIFYREKVNLIHPFDLNYVEPASYTLHAGGEYLIYTEGKKRVSGILDEGKLEIEIPPNGLIYIRFMEYVNIPAYMIARFNLRVKQVYRGLLLGTGPQVEPGFRGHLGCPIHNFTDEAKTIRFFEPIVTIDFEKTTPFGENFFSGKKDEELTNEMFQRIPRGMITVTGLNDLPCKVFTKNSPDRSLQNYLPPGESVRSSVFELEQTVRRVKETVRRFEIIISIGALALLVAMAGLFFNAYSNLKNDIVTLSKSVGILEGAAGAARTNSSAAVQPNTQVASPTSPPAKSQQSSPPLRDNTSTTESPK